MLRRWILKILFPIQVFIGSTHAPFSKKRIKSKDYYALMDIARAGDILLSRTYGELSNLLFPGHFKHAAMISGSPIYVMEAIGSGVKRNFLIDFALTKDELILLRPKFCDADACGRAAIYALSKEGVPYDYEFSSNNESFYCSELIYESYKKTLDDKFDFEMRERLGVKTVSPQDYANANKKFEVIWMNSTWKEVS